MVIAIIQARVGSTRLPNKVFADLAGKPLIYHVVDRLKNSLCIQKIVLATTNNPKDDSLEIWANQNKIEVYRGSEENVLLRFYCAAKLFSASIIVRITADDPFKDPKIIDLAVKTLQNENLDFVYNNKPPSYPEGLDTEVLTLSALQKAKDNSKDPYEHEHVTQFLYRHPSEIKQKNISYYKDMSYLRWTIDTKEDLLMARMVYDELYKSGMFYMDDILNLLHRKPEIAAINSEVPRSIMYTKNICL